MTHPITCIHSFLIEENFRVAVDRKRERERKEEEKEE
jgi:hypothetical protein